LSITPFLFVTLACVIWGLSPLFYRLLDDVDPKVIMSFRVIFSLFFLFFFLYFFNNGKKFFKIKKYLNSFWLILLASLMIGINQYGFIYSISINEVLQASFAYYLFPLLAVSFGFIFFRERFTKLQFIAVFFAFFAIFLLSLGINSLPLISIIMGVTFAIYGMIKKKMDLNPLKTVFIEIGLLSPLALAFLLFIFKKNPEQICSLNSYNYFLLLVSGLITALPLWLFSLSSQQLRYSTLGMINYLNPTLQFLVAVIIFSEPFNNLHLLSFIFIWSGLLLYSYDSIKPSFFKSKKIASTDSHILK
jgi:chloramphenicol-sensitive protein RarD